MTSLTTRSRTGASCDCWRPKDDHGAPRSPHPSLRHRRDRERKLALQEPRLTLKTQRLTPPRSPRLRNPDQLRRGERYPSCASKTRRLQPLEWPTFGRRSWPTFRCRLTDCLLIGAGRPSQASPCLPAFTGRPHREAPATQGRAERAGACDGPLWRGRR